MNEVEPDVLIGLWLHRSQTSPMRTSGSTLNASVGLEREPDSCRHGAPGEGREVFDEGRMRADLSVGQIAAAHEYFPAEMSRGDCATEMCADQRVAFARGFIWRDAILIQNVLGFRARGP